MRNDYNEIDVNILQYCIAKFINTQNKFKTKLSKTFFGRFLYTTVNAILFFVTVLFLVVLPIYFAVNYIAKHQILLIGILIIIFIIAIHKFIWEFYR